MFNTFISFSMNDNSMISTEYETVVNEQNDDYSDDDGSKESVVIYSPYMYTKKEFCAEKTCFIEPNSILSCIIEPNSILSCIEYVNGDEDIYDEKNLLMFEEQKYIEQYQAAILSSFKMRNDRKQEMPILFVNEIKDVNKNKEIVNDINKQEELIILDFEKYQSIITIVQIIERLITTIEGKYSIWDFNSQGGDIQALKQVYVYFIILYHTNIIYYLNKIQSSYKEYQKDSVYKCFYENIESYKRINNTKEELLSTDKIIKKITMINIKYYKNLTQNASMDIWKELKNKKNLFLMGPHILIAYKENTINLLNTIEENIPEMNKIKDKRFIKKISQEYDKYYNKLYIIGISHNLKKLNLPFYKQEILMFLTILQMRKELVFDQSVKIINNQFISNMILNQNTKYEEQILSLQKNGYKEWSFIKNPEEYYKMILYILYYPNMEINKLEDNFYFDLRTNNSTTSPINCVKFDNNSKELQKKISLLSKYHKEKNIHILNKALHDQEETEYKKYNSRINYFNKYKNDTEYTLTLKSIEEEDKAITQMYEELLEIEQLINKPNKDKIFYFYYDFLKEMLIFNYNLFRKIYDTFFKSNRKRNIFFNDNDVVMEYFDNFEKLIINDWNNIKIQKPTESLVAYLFNFKKMLSGFSGQNLEEELVNYSRSIIEDVKAKRIPFIMIPEVEEEEYWTDEYEYKKYCSEIISKMFEFGNLKDCEEKLKKEFKKEFENQKNKKEKKKGKNSINNLKEQSIENFVKELEKDFEELKKKNQENQENQELNFLKEKYKNNLEKLKKKIKEIKEFERHAKIEKLLTNIEKNEEITKIKELEDKIKELERIKKKIEELERIKEFERIKKEIEELEGVKKRERIKELERIKKEIEELERIKKEIEEFEGVKKLVGIKEEIKWLLELGDYIKKLEENFEENFEVIQEFKKKIEELEGIEEFEGMEKKIKELKGMEKKLEKIKGIEKFKVIEEFKRIEKKIQGIKEFNKIKKFEMIQEIQKLKEKIKEFAESEGFKGSKVEAIENLKKSFEMIQEIQITEALQKIEYLKKEYINLVKNDKKQLIESLTLSTKESEKMLKQELEGIKKLKELEGGLEDLNKNYTEKLKEIKALKELEGDLEKLKERSGITKLEEIHNLIEDFKEIKNINDLLEKCEKKRKQELEELKMFTEEHNKKIEEA